MVAHGRSPWGAGLDPAIHVLCSTSEGVDPRDKPGGGHQYHGSSQADHNTLKPTQQPLLAIRVAIVDIVELGGEPN